MYTYLAAYVKPTLKGKWNYVNVSKLVLRDVYKAYKRVVLRLRDSNKATVYLDMSKLDYTYHNSSFTVTDFLKFSKNNGLPTTLVHPVKDVKFVKYRDVFQAGYSVEPVGHLLAPGSQRNIEDLPDALVTRPDTDYTLLHHNALVTVNGLFHRTDASAAGLYVVDACKSAIASGKVQMGLHSFYDLGGFEYVFFNRAMAYKQSGRQAYKNAMHVDLGVPLAGKTLMVSVAGYLHTLDNFYQITGDTTIKLNFSLYPVLERHFQLNKLISTDSLGVSAVSTNNTLVSVAELQGDEYYLRLMELSQSFFILVNAPEVFVDKFELGATGLPDTWTHYARPDKPIECEYGQYCDYVSGKEGSSWVLSGVAEPAVRLLANTYGWKTGATVDASCDPYNDRALPRARIVTIGIDV